MKLNGGTLPLSSRATFRSRGSGVSAASRDASPCLSHPPSSRLLVRPSCLPQTSAADRVEPVDRAAARRPRLPPLLPRRAPSSLPDSARRELHRQPPPELQRLLPMLRLASPPARKQKAQNDRSSIQQSCSRSVMQSHPTSLSDSVTSAHTIAPSLAVFVPNPRAPFSLSRGAAVHNRFRRCYYRSRLRLENPAVSEKKWSKNVAADMRRRRFSSLGNRKSRSKPVEKSRAARPSFREWPGSNRVRHEPRYFAKPNVPPR